MASSSAGEYGAPDVPAEPQAPMELRVSSAPGERRAHAPEEIQPICPQQSAPKRIQRSMEEWSRFWAAEQLGAETSPPTEGRSCSPVTTRRRSLLVERRATACGSVEEIQQRLSQVRQEECRLLQMLKEVEGPRADAEAAHPPWSSEPDIEPMSLSSSSSPMLSGAEENRNADGNFRLLVATQAREKRVAVEEPSSHCPPATPRAGQPPLQQLQSEPAPPLLRGVAPAVLSSTGVALSDQRHSNGA